MIPKEDGSFKTRSKPKVNVQFCWIKTAASSLSYELGVNGEKEVNENCDIINKNGHSLFHTSKIGNFNSSGKEN